MFTENSPIPSTIPSDGKNTMNKVDISDILEFTVQCNKAHVTHKNKTYIV